MPHYHQRKLPNGNMCGMCFMQVRCPACGKVVGLTQALSAEGAELQSPRVFCQNTSCVEAVPCSFELLVQLCSAENKKEKAK